MQPLSDDDLSPKSELLSHGAGIAFGSLSDFQADEDVGMRQGDLASSVGWGDWGGDLSDACVSEPGVMVVVQELLHVASPTADVEIGRRAQHVLAERW